MRLANTYVTLNMYTFFVVTILLVVCLIQRKQSKLINNYLIGWMVAHMLMLCCDSCRWYFRGKIETLDLFVICYFLEYILCYACLIFFHYYLIDYLRKTVSANWQLRLIVWPISITMSALWILSYESRFFYTITYNAVNVPNQNYYLSQLPGLLLLVFDMLLAFSYRKKLGWRLVLALWLSMIFPLIAFPLQANWNSHLLFIGMTLSLLSRYATISSEQNRMLAESRAQLAENRIAITMSQIRPHFLYNALGSISALCDIDPVRARDATDHFAEYLRMNLETLEWFAPIPFQTELKHIQTYIWLEKMRFGEKLQVTYHIQATDFQVPALSVQPLVENAVKHGICARETGGEIVISTQKTEDSFLIQVQDDGVGFCWEEIAERDDGKVHIGIKNVQSRLEAMVRGSLEIRSNPGRGTVAVIRIPRKPMKKSEQHMPRKR